MDYKVAHIIDFFYKKAGLFAVPKATLDFEQRRVIQVFCSIVLSKIEEEEEWYEQYQDTHGNLTPKQIKDLRTFRRIKEVCQTYNGKSNPNYLTSNTNLVSTIHLNSQNPEDKASRYFKSEEPIIVHLPIIITTDPSAKQEISDRYKMENTWTGLWSSDETIYIYIDQNEIDKSIFNMDKFLFLLNHTRTTVRHELQHAVQLYMKHFQQLKEYGGLPSNKVRNMEVDPHGRARRENGPTIDHSFRDIEFYTDLNDAIDNFKLLLNFYNNKIAKSNQYINSIFGPKYTNVLNPIIPQLRSLFFKLYIGELWSNKFSKLVDKLIANQITPIVKDPTIDKEDKKLLTTKNNYNQFSELTFGTHQNPFLTDLKEYAEPKYKKALTEFYKSVRALL